MNGGKAEVRAADADMAWLAHISDWQAEPPIPVSSSTHCASRSAPRRSTSSPRRGDVIGLPSGATPVDFAYAVHTEIGHRTMGAKVNGRLVTLESELKSGDVVETEHLEESGCRTQPGLARIRQEHACAQQDRGWFTKERREEAIEQGKEAIARAMRRQNLPLQQLMSQDSFAEVPRSCATKTSRRWHAAVGEGHVSTQSVLEKVTALVAASDQATGAVDLHRTLPLREAQRR